MSLRLVLAGLLCSVIFFAIPSKSWASDITYNIVNYPINETDHFNSSQDTLSGTIVTDGSLGSITASDIVGGSWTVTNATSGSVTYPITLSSPIYSLSLDATPTELLLPPGGGLLLPNTAGSVQLGYANGDTGLSPSTGFSGGDDSAGPFFVDLSPSSAAGSIGQNSTWIVAAVPEPATFTLLGASLLGVGAIALRRRRAKI